MKKKGSRRRHFSILLLVALCVALTLPAMAETDPMEAAMTARKGIVRIQAEILDEAGHHITKAQTGFLIGDENGAAYVVTTWHGLAFSEQELQEAREAWRTGEDAVSLEGPVYEIIQNGDVHTRVELYKNSEQKDLAIFGLSGGALSPDLSLILEREGEEAPSEVYLLAFPQQDEEGAVIHYSPDSVYVYRGELEDYYQGDATGYQYLRYGVTVSELCSGGPLLNHLGHVVGIQVRPGSEGTSDAVSAEELRHFLDQERIAYRSPVLVAEAAKKRSIAILILGIADGGVLLAFLLQQVLHLRKRGKRKKEEPGSPMALPRKNVRLLRLRTRETIPVDKTPFYLGSSAEKVQYCVQGNAGISRLHACLAFKRGRFYLVDLKSSNGTFLEGHRLEPNHEYEIRDEMRFTLFDEEFVFRCQK